MAELIAMGKWSKTQKKWTLVLPIRRAGKEAPAGRPNERRGPRPPAR